MPLDMDSLNIQNLQPIVHPHLTKPPPRILTFQSWDSLLFVTLETLPHPNQAVLDFVFAAGDAGRGGGRQLQHDLDSLIPNLEGL